MKLVNIALFFTLLFSFSAQAEMDCSDAVQTTSAQCEDLKQVWNQTGGENWSNSQSSNWLQTNNPCDWEGVVCWGSNVAKLNLAGNNLQGKFPDLKNLVSLRTLNIANNQLNGRAPDVSFNTKLQELYLSNNSFSGVLSDFTNNPSLIRFEISNNPDLFGPLVFNGNESSALPKLANTFVCKSRIIDYKHWSSSIAELPECQGMLAQMQELLQIWNINPNDNQDDSHGLNQLLAMVKFDTNEYSSELVLQFDNGIYQFDQQVEIENFESIEFIGKTSYHLVGSQAIANPDPAMGTIFQKSDKFALYWDKQEGAMLSIFGSSNIAIKNIAFYGKTETSNGLNNKDHGIVTVNSCSTQMSGNAFANFGGSVIADFSVEQDMQSYHCNGPSAGTNIKENSFYNICEISTKGAWYGSYGLTIDNNHFDNLKCGLQLYSAKYIESLGGYYTDTGFYEENLRVTNNHITGPGSNFTGYANGIEVTGYSKVLIENNHIQNGPNYGIAVRSHINGVTTEEFDWAGITIAGNQIDNYKQAIYICNNPRANGYQARAENILVNNNTVLSSWNSDQKAHIHLLGQNFANSEVSGNQSFGGEFSIWIADRVGVVDYNNQHFSDY